MLSRTTWTRGAVVDQAPGASVGLSGELKPTSVDSAAVKSRFPTLRNRGARTDTSPVHRLQSAFVGAEPFQTCKLHAAFEV